MNAPLLLQDAATRALSRWLALSAAIALTALGLVANIVVLARLEHGGSTPDSLGFAFFSCVMWMLAGSFLWTPAFRRRCSAFAVTLPLTVRHLWLTHCGAVALLGLVVSSVTTVIGLGMLLLMSRITKQAMLLEWPDVIQMGAAVFVTFVLATVLLQRRSLESTDVRWNRTFIWWAATVQLVGWGMVAGLTMLPAALLLVPVAAATLVARHALQSLPPALATYPPLADDESAPGARPVQRRAPATTAPAANRGVAVIGPESFDHASRRYATASLWNLLFVAINRTAPKSFATVIFGIPGMIFFGLILAGTFDAFDDDGSAAFRWVSIPLTVYLLLAVFGKPLRGLAIFDHLPIARRALFLILTIPGLTLLLLGYGAGRVVVNRFAPNQDVDLRVVTSGCSGVSVPHSLLRIAWDGEPQSIDTPWGETFEAWRVPLYRGSRAVLYSPYCSRDTTGTDTFAALQVSRASEALYGQGLPAPEIQERYLGRATSLPRLPLRQDYPGLRIQERHASLPLLMVFVLCGWFAVTAVHMRSFRSDVSDRGRKWVFGALLTGLMGLHVLQFVPFVFEFTEPWVIDAFWEIHMRSLAQMLPGGTPTIWVLGLFLVAGFYVVAERQFERAEFLLQPPTAR